jgi:hypothetical protein
MSNKVSSHEAVSWAKHRLDDVDATISEVEKAIDKLKDDARLQAEASLARLQASRAKVIAYSEQLRARVDAVKDGLDEKQEALELEWVEVESAIQDFLAAAKDQLGTARDIVAARAQAQRKSWETSLEEARLQAAETVDKARGDLDAAMKHLSDEADKFQLRIGEAKDAGDESWAAVKAGLAEAKAVHSRTIQTIKNSFLRVL